MDIRKVDASDTVTSETHKITFDASETKRITNQDSLYRIFLNDGIYNWILDLKYVHHWVQGNTWNSVVFLYIDLRDKDVDEFAIELKLMWL